MKRFVLLIIMITMSCTCFSQTISLQPKILETKGDTLFCFSIPQSRAIAKALMYYQYQDSLMVQWKHIQWRNQQLLAVKDSSIAVLEQRLFNHQNMAENHKQAIQFLQTTIEVQEQYLRRNKKQKTWMAVGLGLLTLALFIN